MMKKMCNIFKKYKLLFITALIVIVVGIIGIILIKSISKNHSIIKNVNENNYSFKYDSTWNLKEKKEDNIVLEHNSGSKINIQIASLDNEYKYSSIDELIDEISYSIQEQNSDYSLISKIKSKITKNDYDGYKLLYENEEKQVMVNLYKKSDKLVLMFYEAKDDYFDILLDSVHNIVYNFDVNESKFELKNEVKLKTSEASYLSNTSLDNILSSTKEEEIADRNFYVKYTLPNEAILYKYDTTFGQYQIKINDETIYINSSVSNQNIYEKLEDDGVYSFYSAYKNEEKYSNFKETLTKISDSEYLYFNSYDYISFNNEHHSENAELIFELDNNHIFVVKISSTDTPITEKLIGMIKIVESKNYSSYVKIEKEGNNLIAKLKQFADYNNDKVNLVTIKVPDKYEEVDKKQNRYEKRNYAYGYNEKLEVPNYNIEYSLSTFSADSAISIMDISIKTSYGPSKKLTYIGKKTYNGKEFKIYEGGYTDISGVMFTSVNRNKYYVYKKALCYEMQNNGSFCVEIDGNDIKITDEIINELTNFSVSEEEV